MLAFPVAAPHVLVSESKIGVMLVQIAERLSMTPAKPVSFALISSSIFAKFGIVVFKCGLIVRSTVMRASATDVSPAVVVEIRVTRT